MLDVSEIQTIDHDVVVVGAGGAGLRAAIECSAQKLSTGRRLQEPARQGPHGHGRGRHGGGAWATSTRATTGRSTSATRCAAASSSTSGAWPSCTRRHAPDRVHELEEWGAVFDRTKEGLISQRNFGGHRYPRLAHVGDRTGLELIRTLQDHGVHSRHRLPHGVHRARAAQGRRPHRGRRSRYWRETGRFVIFRCKAVILATGGGGKAWPVTSNSWEYTGDGTAMAYEAGAELMDLEFTQFHPTGMVWPLVGARHPGHRGRARRRRHPQEQQGRALHVQLHLRAASRRRPPTR